MVASTDAREWVSQARRGTLELCVLTLVSQEPRYGYELVASLGKWEQLAASEGTLYPLLRRLRKDGCVTTEWRESESGPPRKYYHLTPTGESLLTAMSSEWAELTHAVEELQRVNSPAKTEPVEQIP